MAEPTDETLRPGESLRLASEEDIRPGAVIRIWHDVLNEWIPGWWCEVLRVEDRRVYLRDLRSGAEDNRYMSDTVRSGYLHPRPDDLRGVGGQQQRTIEDRLVALRSEYEALDVSSLPVQEMTAILQRELEWMAANDSRFYDLREEFEIREIALRKVGEELDRRGGMDLMRDVAASLGSPRTLDHMWSGIGGWAG